MLFETEIKVLRLILNSSGFQSVVYGVSWFINFARALCAREVKKTSYEYDIQKKAVSSVSGGSISDEGRDSFNNREYIMKLQLQLMVFSIIVPVNMRFFGMGAISPKYRTSCRKSQRLVKPLFKLYGRDFLNRFFRQKFEDFCSHAEIDLQHLDNESIITPRI